MPDAAPGGTATRPWRQAAVWLCAIGALSLAACNSGGDAAMWQCQLEVQKGNAGRSAEANAERARDIDACMTSAGYRLEADRSGCSPGVTKAACYLRVKP